jgi:anti-sigma factor RsiW
MLAPLRRRRSAVLWRRAATAAALLALVMVSAGTGWWFNELSHGRETDGSAALVVEAQRAHRLFADERGAVEAIAPRSAGLAQSLSERLGAPVTLPEVERAGLVRQGVRLLPTSSGTAAVIVYRDGDGRSISLFIAPVAAADAPARADSGGDVTTFYRIANGLGYALTLPRTDAIPAVTVAFGMQSP